MARVLIVDDSIIMRQKLYSIMEECGHEIVGQGLNGREGMEMYEKLKPDLVTMDISMPIMTGVEAVGKITEKYPDAKIVMISALSQKQMVFEALKNGASHYILKPIEKERVVEVIKEVLNEE